VTDKRARRINDAKAYKQGVDVFRADPSVVLSPPQKTKTAPRKRVAPRTSPKRLRGNSRVFCRARPIFEHESERGEWECVSPLDQGLAVHEGIEKPRVGKGLVKVLRHHTYPSITRIDSDDEVYEQLRYLVEKTKSGSMATLFMYGMTGSGKTYSTSIFQSKAPFELCDAGLLPITTIGYELVGSRCFDLLNEEKNEVFLRVGEDGATHVCGVNKHQASAPEEIVALLQRAAANRETAATGTNATSSRSHAVYQLKAANGGSLTMIDLAGNEGNIETAYHSKEQMTEAAEINSSLMTLRKCLQARALGQSHVPFRESALTRVLRDALITPDAETALLACVSPACSHLERTQATLKAAIQLMGETKPPAVVEQDIHVKGIRLGGPKTWDAEALRSWVAQQDFAGPVVLQAGLTGAAAMKLTVPRLAPMCGGNQDIAKELFAALRSATKEAAEKDKELRRDLKNGPKVVSSHDFSKQAPSKPVVAKK